MKRKLQKKNIGRYVLVYQPSPIIFGCHKNQPLATKIVHLFCNYLSCFDLRKCVCLGLQASKIEHAFLEWKCQLYVETNNTPSHKKKKDGANRECLQVKHVSRIDKHLTT